MMPSHIENSDNDKTTMEKLAAAFRSQSHISDKDHIPKTSRSSRQISNSNNNTAPPPPTLRKRSSGSISKYRPLPQQQQGEDFLESRSSSKRDSTGINYNNLVSAFTDYQQQQQQQQAPNEPPLFTMKRDEPIKLPQTSLNGPPSPKTSSNNNNNKGRVTKRVSATLNTIISPIVHNPHGNSNSGAIGGVLSKTIKSIESIEPNQVAQLLDNTHFATEPLLIDMRPLEEYEKCRIRHSINVSLPGLLMKRYRRGVVSNFNLETFITTPEGTDHYLRWMNRFNIQDNNIQNLPEGAQFIVYDDHMMDEEDTPVWTLMGVIAKNLSTQRSIKWLKHGFHGFEAWDKGSKYMTFYYSDDSTPPLPIPSESLSSSSSSLKKNALLFNANNSNPPNIKLKMPTPMISRSATTLSSSRYNHNNNNNNTNVQRRASLFSLDTTTLRSKSTTNRRLMDDTNKKSSSSISGSGSSGIPPSSGTSGSSAIQHSGGGRHTDLTSINEQSIFSPNSPNSNATSPDSFHTPLTHMPMTAGTPKVVDGEFDFVISEIIPNFLYLGPEISTIDQLSGLKSRSIKRILNMAEECDDDVPGLKETFQYEKIAARDTVEMKNVQGTLKKAVQVIDDSKKHHEPIYVHCKAGKSRSAAAILAYLVLSEHWTLKKAYRHIVKARPNISPNIGFVAELMKLEEGVHGEVSNFAGLDWHLIDLTNPPSPETQREMGRLEKAWKRGRSQSGSRHNSTHIRNSSNGSIKGSLPSFNAEEN